MKTLEECSVVICTAANSRYFPLVAGLVESLRRGRIARKWSFGVLDVGLDQAQREWLTERGAYIAAPEWDVDFPYRDKVPGHYKAMASRPHLPRYFAGFDLILWIDADAWVQDDAILFNFLRAAHGGKLAIVPEYDRCYSLAYKAPRLWGHNQRSFAWSFGLRAGYRYGRNPVLNAGIFALASDAPHWAAWAAAHQASLKRKRRGDFTRDFRFFLSEQTALNYVVFAEKLPATFLPATANWVCGLGLPMWDNERGFFVEPHEPHAPLSVVHLAGPGIKEKSWTLQTLDGGTIETRLTFEAFESLHAKVQKKA
jgi:hypothetical protein